MVGKNGTGVTIRTVVTAAVIRSLGHRLIAHTRHLNHFLGTVDVLEKCTTNAYFYKQKTKTKQKKIKKSLQCDN